MELTPTRPSRSEVPATWDCVENISQKEVVPHMLTEIHMDLPVCITTMQLIIHWLVVTLPLLDSVMTEDLSMEDIFSPSHRATTLLLISVEVMTMTALVITTMLKSYSSTPQAAAARLTQWPPWVPISAGEEMWRIQPNTLLLGWHPDKAATLMIYLAAEWLITM
jgi:hypothetical protein